MLEIEKLSKPQLMRRYKKLEKENSEIKKNNVQRKKELEKLKVKLTVKEDEADVLLAELTECQKTLAHARNMAQIWFLRSLRSYGKNNADDSAILIENSESDSDSVIVMENPDTDVQHIPADDLAGIVIDRVKHERLESILHTVTENYTSKTADRLPSPGPVIAISANSSDTNPMATSACSTTLTEPDSMDSMEISTKGMHFLTTAFFNNIFFNNTIFAFFNNNIF